MIFGRLGKRIMGDSDSEDLDDDDSEEDEEENDKSIVIDNGNNSDSNGEAEGSLDSVTGRKVDGVTSESGSEEEKDTLKNLEFGNDVNVVSVQHEGESPSTLTPDNQEKPGQNCVASIVGTDIASATESIQTGKEVSGSSEPIVVEASSGEKENDVAEASGSLSPKPVPLEDATSKDSDLNKPFNFEEFSSASELEVCMQIL